MLQRGDGLKRLIPPGIISLVVVVLDYITKMIVVANLTLSDYIDVLPFFRIVHVENKGSAFGMFAQLGNTFFIVISFFAILLISVYAIKTSSPREMLALAFIFGGAIGNLIDRIMRGKVIDFIDIYVKGWHWPAFNVADSALTVGIILFLWVNVIKGSDVKNRPLS